MTRVTSYKLLQCSSCGQRHILSNYGSINLSLGYVPFIPQSEDLMVCQRCSAQKPLKDFIPLRTIYKPKRDGTPKWFIPIRKFFDKSYKGPELHPARLYPDLDKTPFDPENYYPASIRKNMIQEDYPLWYFELAKKALAKKEGL
ncbi:hypothetical protein G6653_09310 [Polynucleobacter paneuropaeus]|nr:hypothetical protein [Polynucleobacter paneuropaeus]MBT8611605.1 hypothetical protein [Polynucleobacter paneuropaeus]